MFSMGAVNVKSFWKRILVPQLPFGVVLYQKEWSMYKKPSGELTYSITPQNVRFHLRKECILKKNTNFTAEDIVVSDAFETSL